MTERMDGCDCAAINKDVVEQVRASIPSANDFLAMERLFAVMGNPTRARILLALAQHEMCVCDLSVLLNMSKSAVSHQLANLRDERLVSSRRDGRVVYYEPADPHVALMLQLGLEHAHECCSGRETGEDGVRAAAKSADQAAAEENAKAGAGHAAGAVAGSNIAVMAGEA